MQCLYKAQAVGHQEVVGLQNNMFSIPFGVFLQASYGTSYILLYLIFLEYPGHFIFLALRCCGVRHYIQQLLQQSAGISTWDFVPRGWSFVNTCPICPYLPYIFRFEARLLGSLQLLGDPANLLGSPASSYLQLIQVGRPAMTQRKKTLIRCTQDANPVIIRW